MPGNGGFEKIDYSEGTDIYAVAVSTPGKLRILYP